MLLLCLCFTSYQQLRSYGDGPRLKVSSDRLVKLGIEHVTPGLQGKRFIHFTTAAPKAFECFSSTFQGKFNFQGLFKTVLQVLFKPVRTLFCNHLDEEERAGCFTLIVFLMSCDCLCSVAFPRRTEQNIIFIDIKLRPLTGSAVGWSAVCDCGISWSNSLTF